MVVVMTEGFYWHWGVLNVLQCIGQFLTMTNFIEKHCRVMTFIVRNEIGI